MSNKVVTISGILTLSLSLVSCAEDGQDATQVTESQSELTTQYSTVFQPYRDAEGTYWNALAVTKTKYFPAGTTIAFDIRPVLPFSEARGILGTNPDPIAMIVQYAATDFQRNGVLNPWEQNIFSIYAFNDDTPGLGLGSRVRYRTVTAGYYQLIVIPYSSGGWGQVHIQEWTQFGSGLIDEYAVMGGGVLSPQASIIRAAALYNNSSNIDTRSWSFNFDQRYGYFNDNYFNGTYGTTESALIGVAGFPVYRPGLGTDPVYGGGAVKNRIFADNRANPDYDSFWMTGSN